MNVGAASASDTSANGEHQATLVPQLDAHAKPPDSLRHVFKRAQKLRQRSRSDGSELDLEHLSQHSTMLATAQPSARLPIELNSILEDFLHGEEGHSASAIPTSERSPAAYTFHAVPGLVVYPSLFPPNVQLCLLDRLLHRDLSDPVHKTNAHMHYNVPYPVSDPRGPVRSFFDPVSSHLLFHPELPHIHKPISTQQFLDKKLRWLTLGGQYDWTRKIYPEDPPPPFPADIKVLVDSIFPLEAEAAIVNVYSPGDTLSLHRDVSEQCAQPLVSISLGCEALFVVGVDDRDADGTQSCATLRLRSGDAVLMSGEARFAWHGVPKILPGTCPRWMADWPGHDFPHWKGWMGGKRINLNVRQMFHNDF